MMPSGAVRQLHPAPADRSRAILDSALGCFLEKGVAQTTIQDIQARSGSSNGSIYHFFGSKGGLAGALLVNLHGGYARAFLERLHSFDDLEEGVKGMVRFHLEWVEQNYDAARYLFNPASLDIPAASLETALEADQNFTREVADWLRTWPTATTDWLAHQELGWAVWLGPSQRIARRWLEDSAAPRPTSLASALANAAWAALQAASSALYEAP